jgi:hypothetical protein
MTVSELNSEMKALKKQFLFTGSWFICNDGNLKPEKSNCLILSFGINTDDNFDRDVVQRLDCEIHGFDPFIETETVKSLRRSDKQLESAVSLAALTSFHFQTNNVCVVFA